MLEGAWEQGERAGTGKGASLPSSWKTKQALNPFLVEPALLDAQGTVVSGVPLPPSPSCAAAGSRRVPVSLISAEPAWKMQQGPSSLLCSRDPSALAFPRAGSRPLPTSYPSLEAGSYFTHLQPALLPAPVLQRCWFLLCCGHRAAVGWGRPEPACFGAGWGCPRVTLVAGRPGEGRLSCSGSGSSEQRWLLHMSLGSVVYFFKAGVCFLISEALLCSFPNKA